MSRETDPHIVEFWGNVAHVSPEIFRIALVPSSVLVVSSEPIDEHEHVTLIVTGILSKRWPYMLVVSGAEKLMGYGRARIVRYRSASKEAAQAMAIRRKITVEGEVGPLVAGDEVRQEWVLWP